MTNSRDPLPNTIFTLKVESFRAFRDETRIDARPLTLLYGYNQAGKSTLLRLLVLLADSLQSGAGPLDLQSRALDGASFKELGWLGRKPSFTPRLTLIDPNRTPEPTLKIQFADERGLIVNRVHLSRGNGDKFMVDYDRIIQRKAQYLEASYEGKYRGNDWSGSLTFDNLFPSALPDEAKEIAGQVRESLQALERLQWLHANRLADGEIGSRPARCCPPDGSDLITAIQGPNERSILEQASAWMARQEGMGNQIVSRPNSEGKAEFIHGSPGREDLPIRLAGEGIRALLPILLCSYWAETHEDFAPSMLAIEEPEAHLHPTLQVALFERLVETIQAGIPVVLETHSVYLLRAMQVAVLEKRLAPEQVGLYWVEQREDSAASVTSIEVEPDATLRGWRPDIFEKEQELAHRIFDLRWAGEHGA